jgi:excisionase family DNA binding protein
VCYGFGVSTNTSSGDGEQPQKALVLSPKQAMEALGVSKATLFSLLRTGELPSVLLGPRIRKIRVEEITAYLDRKSAEQKRAKSNAAESAESDDHPEQKAS